MAYNNDNMRNYNTGAPRKRRPMTARERQRRAQARKQRQRIKRIITCIFILFIVLVVCLIALIVKKLGGFDGFGGTSKYTVEAGTAFEDIFENEVTLVSGEYNLSVPGDYDIVIDDGKEREVTLTVVDTIDPVVMPKEQVIVGVGQEIDPMAFIEKSDDATELKGTVVTKVDTSKAGTYEISLKYTDLGGNSTTVKSKVLVTDDNTPPVIACPETHQINVGESVLFSQFVYVSDDTFEASDITVEYDTTALRVNEAGEYVVKIKATDPIGNSSTSEVKIIVIASKYTQEEVDAAADKILAEIITDGMSDKEKATAIYNWIRGNFGYVSHADEGDWLKSAYEGMRDHQGDCYTYAMVSKELLTRAGIKNMDIEKIPAESTHFWNLVDYGEGWYHFDTTPRRVAHNFCLITTKELLEYSNANNKSHNYNPDNYPPIN